MMELKRNLSLAAYLSARKTYLQRKRKSLQARRVHGFPDSLVLFNLICIEVDVLTLYLSFEIRETMNTILYFIALIPLKSLLLPSGSHIVSRFSARAEIPFRLHENFSARAELYPGLSPSPCNRQFDFKRICSRSRAEISVRAEIHHVIGPLLQFHIFYNIFRTIADCCIPLETNLSSKPVSWILTWER